MRAVIDTNILVSALWSRKGPTAKILDLVANEIILPCYSSEIFEEYREVLFRPKFGFADYEINEILAKIRRKGLSVIPINLDIDFIDKDDKKFYEVAKSCNAVIITGNTKHFPREDMIMTPGEFLERYHL